MALPACFCYKARPLAPGGFQFAGKITPLLPNMSQHRSLRGVSSLAAKRNVLKRFERIEVLKKRGLWQDGDRITGLPKTKPATS